MIGSIRGKVILQTEKFALVETNGVGYKINVSQDTLSKIQKKDKEEFFFTHTHVREDILDLYGFLNYSELEFFEMLISVSGVGPKSALAILGITSIETLRKAIGTSDTSYLTKISGIGKKTAEKIVLELRDKLADEIKNVKGQSSLREELDALEALKSLGYSQNEAREALKKVSLGHSRTGEATELNTNIKIKEALKILGGK